MISLRDAEQASKKFTEQEFYNSHYMSVGIAQKKDYELIVYLFKKIRTENLPVTFEGLKVIYEFSGQPQPR